MVDICQYPGCCNRRKTVRLRAPSSSGGALTFHKFPVKNPERLKLWLRAICRNVNTPAEKLKASTLCCEHFNSHDFKPFKGKSLRYLKSTAVPAPRYLFPTNQDLPKVAAQASPCSLATDEETDEDEETDVQETKSPAYIAFPSIHSQQTTAVNQLQLLFQPKLLCQVSCQTEVFTRDAACQTDDPPIKKSVSTQCNESTQIKQHEKHFHCSSHTSDPLAASLPLKRPTDDITSHAELTNLSICNKRLCRENLSAPSNRKLQKSTHVPASAKENPVLTKLKSEYQLKSEDQLDICKVSVLENADITPQSPTSTVKEEIKEEPEQPENRLEISTGPVPKSDKIDHSYAQTPKPVTLHKKSHLTGLFQTCLQCGGPVLEYTTVSSGSQNRLQWKCSMGHLMWLFPNTNPS